MPKYRVWKVYYAPEYHGCGEIEAESGKAALDKARNEGVEFDYAEVGEPIAVSHYYAERVDEEAFRDDRVYEDHRHAIERYGKERFYVHEGIGWIHS